MLRKNKLLLLIFLNCLVLSCIFVAQSTPLGVAKYQDISDSETLNSEVYYHFDPQIKEVVGSCPAWVAIGDVNNDGYNDFVTANYADNDVLFYLWNNTLKDWIFSGRRDVGNTPFSIVIGDANNDGFQDIITANLQDYNVSILLWNNTLKNWNPQITKNVGGYPWSVFVGDANNDGYNDIVTANALDNNVSILLWNNVAKNWNNQVTKLTGNAPEGVFIGDANNDGFNDIVTVNNAADTVSILVWSNVSKNWNPQIVKGTGSEPESVFIADANNDGFNDIIAANYAADNVSILLWNNNTLNWNSQILRSVGEGPESLFVGDANNDGFNDIITADSWDNTTSLLLWDNNTQNWDSRVTLPVGARPSCAAVGDINDDNFNDIVVSNYDEMRVSIILWNPAPKTPVLDFEGVHPAHHVVADGIVRLNWTAVEQVTKYYIYRSINTINGPNDIIGLTPIAAVSSTNYTDIIATNRYYWYVIVAGNAVKNGSISNSEYVKVAHPISTPVLDIASASVDIDEVIHLTWSPVENASFYSIYRDTNVITAPSGLICIGGTNLTNFNDTLSEAGTYYYIIVATDGYVNSNISNCVIVTVKSPIPGFEPLISLFALMLITFIFIRKKGSVVS